MTVLFVVGTIVFFLIADAVVRKFRGEAYLPALQPAKPSYHPVRVPEGIFFAKSHTWVNLFPSGKVRVGIDDFVERLLENPTIIFTKRRGDSVKKGDPLMLLKSDQRTLTIRSPLEGNIIDVNDDLPKNPASMQSDLFGDGWGYVIKPTHASQLKEFFLGDEARTWIKDEFRRLRELLANIGKSGAGNLALMQDGGLPASGVLNKLDDSVCALVEQAFLEVQ